MTSHRCAASDSASASNTPRFMAAKFQALGIAAVAISGTTPADRRRGALSDLAEGRVQVVFSVDLFNEGVDIPTVDVVLMLRPTESATLVPATTGPRSSHRPEQDGLHRTGLRRHAPPRIPLRPPLPGSARRDET